MEINLDKVKIINEDSRRLSNFIEKDSVDFIVFSPPYWNLRDYGYEEQIGLKDSYQKYLDKMKKVFEECYKVLKYGRFMAINIGTVVSNKGMKFIANYRFKCECNEVYTMQEYWYFCPACGIKIKSEELKMEIEVQKSQSAIEDGLHYGTIERIEYRNVFETDKNGNVVIDKDGNKKLLYVYADLFIKEEKSGISLKYGSPARITDKTKLGKLLMNFTELVEGHKVDPEKILVGKRIKFVTITQKTNEGEFANIAEGSIKPL